MPKSKGPRKPSRSTPITPARITPQDHGLRAFHAGQFDLAIAAWTPRAGREPKVAVALAEAHFRRALARMPTADPLADLRRAIALAPADLRYQYHLGRALQRAGQLAAAVAQYRA